jgi:NAD(P)-dependent dehydrogenase (short-subunit alcohol dehydrogenase family)
MGRNENDGTAAVETLRPGGGTIKFCRGDVKDQATMENIAATVAASYGGVDILCANAGIFPQAQLEEMTEYAWDDVLATNLRGMFFSIKACLPYLKKSKAGRIVLTSSITGPLTGYPGWSHYGATKAGMLGFMRTAVIESAQFKIPSTPSCQAMCSLKEWLLWGRSISIRWPPRFRCSDWVQWKTSGMRWRSWPRRRRALLRVRPSW